MKINQEEFKKVIFNPFFYLIGLTILNGILLFGVTKLAPPDYYKYFFVAENLFKGNLHSIFIPPIFPSLLFGIGTFIKLFLSTSDAFILAGKLMSLLSGIGIVLFSYKILGKTTKKFAMLGTLFIVVSPFYLQYLVFPITDMLYLLFVLASFYFLYVKKSIYSLISVLLGALTRYEGILLVLSYIINFIRFRKKELIKYLVVVGVISPGIFLFYFKFGKRFVNKIEYIIDSKVYLYFIHNPKQLISIIYSSILYFIPNEFPKFIHWAFAYLLILLFFIGIYKLLKHNIQLGLAVLFYEIAFVIAKGYIFTVNKFNLPAEHHIRRFLSFIFIFYIVALLGLYELILFIKEKTNKKSFFCLRILIYISLAYIIFYKYLIAYKIFLVSILFILPIIILFYKKLRIIRIEKILSGFLLFLFFTNIYLISFKKAYRYVYSGPNKGAYVIAKWINNKSYIKSQTIAVFSSTKQVQYYLKKRVKMIYFIPKDETIYKNRDKLYKYLLHKIKKNKIKYIAFDGYINPIDRPGEAALKKILFDISKKGKCFKIKKILTYNRNYAATVLKTDSNCILKSTDN